MISIRKFKLKIRQRRAENRFIRELLSDKQKYNKFWKTAAELPAKLEALKTKPPHESRR